MSTATSFPEVLLTSKGSSSSSPSVVSSFQEPLCSPSVTSETVVSPLVTTVSGSSEQPAQVLGPHPPSDLPLPPCKRKSLTSHSLAFFRQRGQEAGLSQRAADFAASSFRASTRVTYDSRLAGVIDWCSKSSTDPSSASLGCVADFLISLFDRNLALATIRGYRSAIASSHRGFQDGSTVTNSLYISRLLKAFFLKRPPCRSLVPSWSLPTVLRCLAEAPFEPLHKASLQASSDHQDSFSHRYRLRSTS